MISKQICRGRLFPQKKKAEQRKKKSRLIRLRGKTSELIERENPDVHVHTNTKADNVLQLQEANAHLVIASIESHIMAEMLEKSRAEMSHLANHDFLTDLPNRMQLYDRINQAITLAKRNISKFTILFMDLDRFKKVNDSFGHVIGDQLLQSVAQRLTSTVRESDTVSRLGGDEFVLLLPNTGDRVLLVPFIEKIHSAVSSQYTIDGNDLDIGATIGISIFPEDGEDAETLICHADAAMYQAKENRRNTYNFYRGEMQANGNK